MIDLEKVRKYSGLIGESESIQQVFEMISQVAPIDISVLITGESGTGKEMVARAIHKLSVRSTKPIVIVNCGAIPSGIIESELFGYKKGAFTGAVEDRKGYFEEAHEGIIFLDEIGETPLETQVKLLRVLETGEFMRVGDAKTRKVDVRVIAATNKDLAQEIEKGTFRKDLFFRLRTVTIRLPNLRERLEDIDLLVERFGLQFARANDIPYRGFTTDALKVMKKYNWPGNVRELKNFVESILLFEKGQRISSEAVVKHLQPYVQPTSSNLPVIVGRSPEQAEREVILQQLLFLRQDMRDIKSMISMDQPINRPQIETFPKEISVVDTRENEPVELQDVIHIQDESIGNITMAQLECEAITRTLKKFKNSRRKTARVLGISERSLYRKINEYGLEKKQKRKKSFTGN